MLAVFAPGLFAAAPRAPGIYPDVYHFVWNAWYLQSVAPGLSYRTTLVFWPEGTSLYLHTLTEGILWPLCNALPGLPPWRIYVAGCALCFLLNGVAAFLLFWRLSSSALVAALLAALFAMHPFWLAHLDGGHLNMLAFFPVIFGAHACLVATDSSVQVRKRVAAATLASTCLAFLPFANLYYFYFGCMLLAAACGAALIAQRRDAARVLGLVLCAGVVLSAVRLYPTAEAALSGEFTPNHDPGRNGLDVSAFAAPGPYQQISRLLGWGVELAASPNPTESAGYIGFPMALLLCIVALKGAGRWRAMVLGVAVAFLLLACGPNLRIFGLGGGWNPLYAAISWLPLFPSVPARFFCVALLLLLAALAIYAKRARTIVLSVGVLVGLEWLPAPIEWRSLAASPLLERVRSSELSALHDASGSFEERMFHQVQHQKPILAGFLARRPLGPLRRTRQNPLLSFIEGRRKVYGGAGAGADLEALKIDGVIVPVAEREMAARAAQVPGLVERDRDTQLVLFTRAP